MGIGNIAEFYQYRRHVGVQVNIEMIGYICKTARKHSFYIYVVVIHYLENDYGNIATKIVLLHVRL